MDGTGASSDTHADHEGVAPAASGSEAVARGQPDADVGSPAAPVRPSPGGTSDAGSDMGGPGDAESRNALLGGSQTHAAPGGTADVPSVSDPGDGGAGGSGSAFGDVGGDLFTFHPPPRVDGSGAPDGPTSGTASGGEAPFANFAVFASFDEASPALLQGGGGSGSAAEARGGAASVRDSAADGSPVRDHGHAAAESGGSGAPPERTAGSSDAGDVGGPPASNHDAGAGDVASFNDFGADFGFASRGGFFEPAGVGPGGTAEEVRPRGDIGGDVGEHQSGWQPDSWVPDAPPAAALPRPVTPPPVFGPGPCGAGVADATGGGSGGSGGSTLGSTGVAAGSGGSGGSGAPPPPENPGDVGSLSGSFQAGGVGSSFDVSTAPLPRGPAVGPGGTAEMEESRPCGDVGGNHGEHPARADSHDDEWGFDGPPSHMSAAPVADAHSPPSAASQPLPSAAAAAAVMGGSSGGAEMLFLAGDSSGHSLGDEVTLMEGRSGSGGSGESGAAPGELPPREGTGDMGGIAGEFALGMPVSASGETIDTMGGLLQYAGGGGSGEVQSQQREGHGGSGEQSSQWSFVDDVAANADSAQRSVGLFASQPSAGAQEDDADTDFVDPALRTHGGGSGGFMDGGSWEQDAAPGDSFRTMPPSTGDMPSTGSSAAHAASGSSGEAGQSPDRQRVVGFEDPGSTPSVPAGGSMPGDSGTPNEDVFPGGGGRRPQTGISVDDPGGTPSSADDSATPSQEPGGSPTVDDGGFRGLDVGPGAALMQGSGAQDSSGASGGVADGELLLLGSSHRSRSLPDAGPSAASLLDPGSTPAMPEVVAGVPEGSASLFASEFDSSWGFTDPGSSPPAATGSSGMAAPVGSARSVEDSGQAFFADFAAAGPTGTDAQGSSGGSALVDSIGTGSAPQEEAAAPEAYCGSSSGFGFGDGFADFDSAPAPRVAVLSNREAGPLPDHDATAADDGDEPCEDPGSTPSLPVPELDMCAPRKGVAEASSPGEQEGPPVSCSIDDPGGTPSTAQEGRLGDPAFAVAENAAAEGASAPFEDSLRPSASTCEDPGSTPFCASFDDGGFAEATGSRNSAAPRENGVSRSLGAVCPSSPRQSGEALVADFASESTPAAPDAGTVAADSGGAGGACAAVSDTGFDAGGFASFDPPPRVPGARLADASQMEAPATFPEDAEEARPGEATTGSTSAVQLADASSDMLDAQAGFSPAVEAAFEADFDSADTFGEIGSSSPSRQPRAVDGDLPDAHARDAGSDGKACSSTTVPTSEDADDGSSTRANSQAVAQQEAQHDREGSEASFDDFEAAQPPSQPLAGPRSPLQVVTQHRSDEDGSSDDGFADFEKAGEPAAAPAAPAAPATSSTATKPFGSLRAFESDDDEDWDFAQPPPAAPVAEATSLGVAAPTAALAPPTVSSFEDVQSRVEAILASWRTSASQCDGCGKALNLVQPQLSDASPAAKREVEAEGEREAESAQEQAEELVPSLAILPSSGAAAAEAEEATTWEQWVAREDNAIPLEACELFANGVTAQQVPLIPFTRLGCPAGYGEPYNPRRSKVREAFFSTLGRHMQLPLPRSLDAGGAVSADASRKGGVGGAGDLLPASLGGDAEADGLSLDRHDALSSGALPPAAGSGAAPAAVSSSMPSMADADWGLFDSSSGAAGASTASSAPAVAPLRTASDSPGLLAGPPSAGGDLLTLTLTGMGFDAQPAAAEATAASGDMGLLGGALCTGVGSSKSYPPKVRAFLSSLPDLRHLSSPVIA